VIYIHDVVSHNLPGANEEYLNLCTAFAVDVPVSGISSPDMATILADIKTEVQSVMPVGDEKWSKTAVQSMVQTDAILRESMRYSSFMTSALDRTVIAKQGITTPSGLHIKPGNFIAVPAFPIHSDPNNYSDPTTFVPHRFLRSQGEAD
jgi:cytochrome P450